MAKKLTQNQQSWNKEINRIKRQIREAEKRGYEFSGFTLPSRPARVTKKQLDKLHSIRKDAIYKYATYEDPLSNQRVSGLEGRKIERSRAARKVSGTSTSLIKPSLRTGKEPKENKKTSNVNRKGVKQGKKNGKVSDEKEKEIDGNTKTLDTTDLVLSNVEAMISEWQPTTWWTPYFKVTKERDTNILRSMLNAAIMAYGRDAVAKRLQDNAEEVNRLVEMTLYSSGGGSIADGGSGRLEINRALTRLAVILKDGLMTIEERKQVSEVDEDLEYLDPE